MHYGELDFLQEPAELRACGEEEEGLGGLLGAAFSKIARGHVFQCRQLSMCWCSLIRTDGG